MPNTYERDQVVKFNATIQDSAGDAADPDTATFRLLPPDGVEISYTWPTDSEVVRDSVGAFHVLHTVTVAGRHPYRWETTGAVTVADEDVILVRHSAFAS